MIIFNRKKKRMKNRKRKKGRNRKKKLRKTVREHVIHKYKR